MMGNPEVVAFASFKSYFDDLFTQVLRGMPNGEGPKLVEKEDGIGALERFQFHENDELRCMANGLVDKYFGEDYGLDQ